MADILVDFFYVSIVLFGFTVLLFISELIVNLGLKYSKTFRKIIDKLLS